MNSKASFVLGILLTITIMLIFKTISSYSSSIDGIYSPIFCNNTSSTSSTTAGSTASKNTKLVSN